MKFSAMEVFVVSGLTLSSSLCLAATITHTGTTAKQKVTAPAIASGTPFVFVVGPASGTMDTLKIKINGPSGTVATVNLGTTTTPFSYSWVPAAGTPPGKYQAKWKATETTLGGATDTEIGTIKPECMPGGASYPC